MAWPPLPKRVHYALKSLCCLARAQGPVQARELAQRAGIPPAQAAKILYLLTWAGFLSSRRGSKGGFWLRVPAQRLRVKEVVEFFHPPAEGDRHEQDLNDPILQFWQQVTTSTGRAFETLTLADLLRERGPAQSTVGLDSEDAYPSSP